MPIYEFRCKTCGALNNVFVRTVSSPLSPVCSKCGGADLARLVSRPVILKGTESRMEDFDIERSLGRLDDPYDPRSVARWARAMGGELGDELGEELREMAESVESDQEMYDPYDSGGSSISGGEYPSPDDPPFPAHLV